MTNPRQAAQLDPLAVEIGGIPIAIRTENAAFRELLTSRYAGFVRSCPNPELELAIDLFEPAEPAKADEDLQVRMQGQEWCIERGDFRACWNPVNASGRVRQSASPYAIDSVLRIIHTLILAKQGGFLIHAASAIRSGRAFLFAGVSGAGKTTISRLAPPDVHLLTDEISYVVRKNDGYRACGTPFAGELARVGENRSAPLSTLFLLEKGPENRIEPVGESEALRAIMRHILFFAEDSTLVNRVFDAACEFVNQVPVRKLIFVPDERVWDIIGQQGGV
jgi:hypothetical protein